MILEMMLAFWVFWNQWNIKMADGVRAQQR